LRVGGICLLYFVVPLLTGAESVALQPGQVAVVYNRNVTASRELAAYYAGKRHIPAGNLLGLDLPFREGISRATYLQRVVGPLRSWLEQSGLKGRIRCIALVYGVPLRISDQKPSRQDRRLVKAISAELEEALRELDDLLADAAKRVGLERPANAPASSLKVRASRSLRFYERIKAAFAKKLDSQRDLLAGRDLAKTFMKMIRLVEGYSGLLAHMKATGPAGRIRLDAMRLGFESRRGRLRDLLKGCPKISPDRRREAHLLLKELYGLKGLIKHLQEDKARLLGRETGASVDSELSLLWHDNYPLYRWVLNAMSIRVQHLPEFRSLADDASLLRPVMMVARLDASSPEIVRRMIDDSLFAERRGLIGKFYIDARGLRKPKSLSKAGYWRYDENLRQLARLLKSKASIEVVLDDRSALFGPGDCNDAALYCGWYRLGKYLDAFQWVRGAVGYHIASSEAVSLHKPGAQYWCKRMLEDGVAATLGPVAEPYLGAFPLPRDFFGLLLTGRYSLVECFYMTKPFNSWMIVLIGDPLYRPFASKPLLKSEDVFPAAWLSVPQSQSTRPASHR